MLEVLPYEGIDTIKFGMEQDEVISSLGKAESECYVFDEEREVIDEEIRKKACYQYVEGKLACVTYTVEALIQNPLAVHNQKLPCTYMELIRTLKALSEINHFDKSRGIYYFDDLGLVVYMRKIIDIKMGRAVTCHKFVLAICDRVSYLNYTKFKKMLL